jgi:hypothetical protein
MKSRGTLWFPLITKPISSVISLYLFLKERTKEKIFLTSLFTQNLPFLPSEIRASALQFFKKETIGGKSIKKQTKIDIYNKL